MTMRDTEIPDAPKTQCPLSRRAFVTAALAGLAGCGGGGGGSGEDGQKQAASPAPGSNPPPSPPAPATPPAPEPSPPPSPPPVAAPEAPPVSIDPRIVLEAQDMRVMVILKSFHQESRYERYRRLQVIRSSRAELPFHGFDFTAGGVPVPLKGGRYTLHCDGTQIAAVNVTPGETREATFDADFSAVADGWREMTIRGLTGGETSPTWFVFVKKSAGSAAVQAFTPVVRGTYELTQATPGWCAYAKAPGRYAPTPVPLPSRLYPGFSELLPLRELNCMQIVPVRFGDSHRPSRNVDGVTGSFDLQSYFWFDMVAKSPRLPSLDGPRGVGNILMTTHVSIGQAAPDGRPRNTLYVCDPWRIARVTEDGTVTTLVGYRHANLPSYWEDPAEVELVGDWSAVPVERRGFHELWGMAWDERTLGVNESAPPIPAEGNERPHSVGPVMFLTDTQNDRVIKCEFSATSRSTPAKVTEFVTGSQDAWDIVYSNGVIYVSERKAHRIAAYDARTGAYIRTVVQGRPLATVDRNRFVGRLASDAEIQAEPCVAPEGLYKLAGDPWLYFGSLAMKQVRRVNLENGQVEVVCPVPTDINSLYFKIAVSDGTFGPRGTVFVWSWSMRQYGFPFTYLPPGVTFRNWEGEMREWKWFEGRSEVGQWAGFNYATAGAVGNGRLVAGGACEGLLVISRRQPGDRGASEASERGEREFRNRGLNLLYGHFGFGYYGLPLPWGVSPNLDAFFELHGHRRA